MKRFFAIALLLLCATSAAAGDDKYIKQYAPAAKKGDYQAQRNLAYTYATSRDPSVSNPMLGCAWYLVILMSGSPKIHDGDIGNAQVYCQDLSPQQQKVAEAQAKRLYSEIY